MASMANRDEQRIAVLIDADNASARHIDQILLEVASYGRATVRRAYGDWTKDNLSPWKKTLLEHSIQPMQQFAYTTGKNATDSAMIIDAMDLLYSGNLDAMCIVSSDSDFTRLAGRVRESGLIVIGFGERKTPEPFRTACDKFIEVENLAQPDDDDNEDSNTPSNGDQSTSDHPSPIEAPGLTANERKKRNKLLQKAVDAAADDDGWASLSLVGNNLTRMSPDFDPRTWGYSKLKDLLDQHQAYEVKFRKSKAGQATVAYVKRK